jgi:histidinol-phosphate phosphatase family protein
MLRLAVISEHASPLAALGGVDAGGQNVYVYHLAKCLAQLGHRVDIFTRRDEAALPEVVDWLPGVRIVHVPAGPPSFVAKEELLGCMEEFARFFIAFARRERYQLAHANFWMSGLVARRAKQALGLPFVITFHALGRVRRLHQGDADRSPAARLEIEDQVVAAADCVIAECPQDRSDLLQWYPSDPERIAVVPCGFDPSEFEPVEQEAARRRLGFAADEPLILQLGRMVPRKGIDNVIRALRLLRERHATPARLAVVGGASESPCPAATPEIGRLLTLAHAQGVADLVTFVGRRDRASLKYFYSAADVFVTTPWYEPFGITPLEAMACGTPVVGAAVGGIKFTVLDGQTGYLVPPQRPELLAERLAHLLADPTLLALMGRRAAAHVRQLFTWDSVTQGIVRTYEQVVERARRDSKPPVRLVASRGRVLEPAPQKRAVFIDKDGTLIEDVPYNVKPELVRFSAGALEGLHLLHQQGYLLCVVTNQPGVGLGLFDEHALDTLRRHLEAELLRSGVPLAGFYYCAHHPLAAVAAYRRRCDCRKPRPGLLERAAREHGIRLAESWLVGDILDDVEAGRRAGCRTVLLDNGNEMEWKSGPLRTPDGVANDLHAAAQLIVSCRGRRNSSSPNSPNSPNSPTASNSPNSPNSSSSSSSGSVSAQARPLQGRE